MRFPRATRQMVVRIAGKRMYLWGAVDHKARSSTSWFSAVETGTLPSSSYASRASRRRGWRRISCAPPALRSSTSGFPDTMSRACDRTIGPENPHQVVRRRGFPDQGRNFPDGLI